MIVISLKQNNNFNAGPKAPKDIRNILIDKYNAKPIDLYIKENGNIFDKIKLLLKTLFSFTFLHFKKDIIVYQHPITDKKYIIDLIPKKRSILLIHDVRKIRYPNKNYDKEIALINSFPYVIAHNKYMKKELINLGVTSKIYTLDLFDYLCDDLKNKKQSKEIVYTGNFEKSLFLHQVEEQKMDFKINIYGVLGNCTNNNSKIIYKGKKNPEELPNEIEGYLGLVWDGNYDDTLDNEGLKRYTMYNNPHKLSCYIASAIPVIVWEKSAVADFVLKNNIGYVINNIYDINNLDLSSYDEKLKNVKKISSKVRNGYYTKCVIDKIIGDIND